MHQRFLSWLLIGVCFVAFGLRAEAQGALKGTKGKILVARVGGTAAVTKTVGTQTTRLAKEMEVEESAKVVTGADSFVVLAFSNGATTRLGPDSELVIAEFLQDPFPDEVKPSAMTEEPSPSRTKLLLNKGELVGDVKTLKRKTDGFTVQTPVGAAGVRGTVFRIVFRPAANGQSTFQLTTTSGLVEYTGQQTSNITAQGTANVNVEAGMTVDVDVTINAQGQTIITVLPPTQTNGPTSAAASAAASEIAAAVATTVFLPPVGGAPPAGSIGSGTVVTNFTTQNTTGTIQATDVPPQNAIPAGQLQSQP